MIEVLAYYCLKNRESTGRFGNNLLDPNPKIVFSHHHFAAGDEFLVHIHIHTGIGGLVELHD